MSAHVTLTLDRRAPKLALYAPRWIDPPAPLPLKVTTDEPLAWFAAFLTDASGVRHTLGAGLGAVIEMTVDSAGLVTGPAVFTVLAVGRAGNLSQASTPVHVVRAAKQLAHSDEQPGLDVELHRRRAFDVEVGHDHG